MNIFSEERKQGQINGDVPAFMSTASYQMFKSKYLYKANTIRQQYERIAKTMAKHIEGHYPEWWHNEFGHSTWAEVFFQYIWSGRLSPSTPILANAGTTRGLVVSCSGNYVGDSVQSFYEGRLENAILSKHGFGTSSYLGDIRHRGAPISVGGKASGVCDVFQMFKDDSVKITQGSARRGAWAGYVPITHKDFGEVASYVAQQVDDINVGWILDDHFAKGLQQREPSCIERFTKSLKLRMETGKGYYFFVDKVNRARPQMLKDQELYVKASNLCTEITLPSDPDHTFTCVLSSLNLGLSRDSISALDSFVGTVFLDCVNEEFIQRASGVPYLDKAVRFASRSRALGLGLMGLHTWFQRNGWAFDSYAAHRAHLEMLWEYERGCNEATQWLGSVLGEAEWTKGYGVRNTHTRAVAPTKSTSLICGGVSEGINPDTGMVFTQSTTAGEVHRVAPVLLDLMKQRGVFTEKEVSNIGEALGSVQHVDWLDEDEKAVFKNAFEIDMKNVIRLGSIRQKHLDQSQSLNLFFSESESAQYIAEVHKEAILDENIQSLYYCYGRRGVPPALKGCEACQ